MTQRWNGPVPYSTTAEKEEAEALEREHMKLIGQALDYKIRVYQRYGELKPISELRRQVLLYEAIHAAQQATYHIGEGLKVLEENSVAQSTALAEFREKYTNVDRYRSVTKYQGRHRK